MADDVVIRRWKIYLREDGGTLREVMRAADFVEVSESGDLVGRRRVYNDWAVMEWAIWAYANGWWQSFEEVGWNDERADALYPATRLS